MIIYYASNLTLQNVYTDLQNKRTSNENPANLLSCPAVREGWHNVFSFSLKESTAVTYALAGVSRIGGEPISQDRKPHLEGTNIFNLETPTYLFCEEPLKIKVTAPYFHNVTYQKEGTFVGGVFDIGRWFRPIESEIITWAEKGVIEFKKNEPLFYVEFLTENKVTLKQYVSNQVIEHLANGLVNAPFQNVEGLQGSLESRYQAFENSDYRKGLIEEIKAALVDKVE